MFGKWGSLPKTVIPCFLKKDRIRCDDGTVALMNHTTFDEPNQLFQFENHQVLTECDAGPLLNYFIHLQMYRNPTNEHHNTSQGGQKTITGSLVRFEKNQAYAFSSLLSNCALVLL